MPGYRLIHLMRRLLFQMLLEILAFQELIQRVTELTMGVTATGYDTLSQKIRLTCQNSIVTILINAVTLSAVYVNSFIMDTSTLDNANIQ